MHEKNDTEVREFRGLTHRISPRLHELQLGVRNVTMELCISTDARTPSCAPPPSAAAASFTSAIIVAVLHVIFRESLLIFAVVHRVRVPLLSLLALARRRAWRAVTPLTLATVNPK